MTRKQSNNEWSDGIAAHHTPKIPSANICWKICSFNYFPKGQTTYEDYYSSLLVQLKDILKEKCGVKICKGVLSLKDNATRHRTLATQKKLAYLDFHCTDHTLFSGSGLVGIPPLPWTGKIIEESPFFVRHGGHPCRGDLVGRTNS